MPENPYEAPREPSGDAMQANFIMACGGLYRHGVLDSQRGCQGCCQITDAMSIQYQS
jgi:hypothetical protein